VVGLSALVGGLRGRRKSTRGSIERHRISDLSRDLDVRVSHTEHRANGFGVGHGRLPHLKGSDCEVVAS
jgi:hypothetical protein